MISDVQKAKTLIEIDADTSGARREIKKLSDEEKRAADERKKNAKEWQTFFTELNSAHQLAAKGVKVFGDLMRESAEHARLTTATYGIQIEKLRQSSMGLVSNMELMRRAASLTAGEFKKTTDELAAAEGAIRALTLRGVEQKKAQEAIHKLMNEFNAGPLKDLGVGLDLAAMKTDTAAQRIAAYGDAMKVVNSLADESAKKGLQTGEAWAQGATTAQDAWDKFKRSLVAEWNPMKMKSQAGRLGYFTEDVGYGTPEWKERMKLLDSGYDPDKMANAVRTMDALVTMSDSLLRDQLIREKRTKTAMAAAYSGPGRVADAIRGGGGGRSAEVYQPLLDLIQEGGVYRGAPEGYIPSYVGGLDEFTAPGQPDVGGYLNRFYGAGGEQSLRDAANYNDFLSRRSESQLEGIFGPLSDFNAYQSAFEALTGAVGSAYGAWIDGSMSAGEAFKKFIAESLKAMAVQMAMEALKHGAYALGSLAFGNVAGAAAHGKAAAGFAAGAVLVGAAAKGLHSGSGSASGASAPGGGVPAYSGGGSGQQQGTTTVIAYGQDFSNDSAYQRQLRAARVLEDARQASGSGGGITYA